MRATTLIKKLQHLVEQHGDMSVLMDVDAMGPYKIGEVDVDVDDTGITKPDGSRFTYDELREAFYDDIAAGKEVVPIGECDNFDFKTGCLGHPVAESV
jgi:hypothetical protein